MGTKDVLTTTALQAYKEPSKDCRGLFLAASQARDQNERDDMMTRMLKLDAPKINDLNGKDVARACLYSAANPAKLIAKYIQPHAQRPPLAACGTVASSNDSNHPCFE